MKAAIVVLSGPGTGSEESPEEAERHSVCFSPAWLDR